VTRDQQLETAIHELTVLQAVANLAQACKGERDLFAA
jgi:hypothetical protein